MIRILNILAVLGLVVYGSVGHADALMALPLFGGISLTGKSAGKRAAGLAKTLTAHQQSRARIQALRNNAGLLGKAAAMTGAYGLPGMESSGVQGIRGQLLTGMRESAENERWESAMARMAQKEAARAKSAAGNFQIAMMVATVVTMGASAYFGAAASAVPAASGSALGTGAAGSMFAGMTNAQIMSAAAQGAFGTGVMGSTLAATGLTAASLTAGATAATGAFGMTAGTLGKIATGLEKVGKITGGLSMLGGGVMSSASHTESQIQVANQYIQQGLSSRPSYAPRQVFTPNWERDPYETIGQSAFV